MSKKPIIGIPVPLLTTSTFFNGHKKSLILTNSYVDWMIEMGCIPLFIPITIDLNDVSFFADKLDGLLLPGGQDIDPSFYREKQKVEYSDNIKSFGSMFHRPLSLAPDSKRDLIEINLYNLAKKNKLPILGICRGLQLINVAEGGTLHQEIPTATISHSAEDDGLTPYHEISIEKSSQCYKLLGVEKYFTSSMHHQAINQLGSDLSASSKAIDGIIEIIESKNTENFIFGIQGHPEITRKNLSLYNRIFLKFVEHAKKSKGI
ncbi:MAG: gamma-glutamyl-gamma-aminobutyrate hydrolase family protein [Parachlamydiales bacterium]|jgi:putative glutamine amidotransferase